MGSTLGDLKRELKELKYAFNVKKNAISQIAKLLHEKLDTKKKELSDDDIKSIIVQINSYTDEPFMLENIIQKRDNIIIN